MPDGLDIRDWKGFEAGVTSGYHATHEVLAMLDRPVTALRRRVSISESTQPETAVETATASLRPDMLEMLRRGARRGRRQTPRP